MLSLIDLIITLPSGSVKAERGFSQMNIMMTDWRSRLRDTSLTDQLTVVLASPGIEEYNPEDAVHLWVTAGARSRRPNYIDYCNTDSES